MALVIAAISIVTSTDGVLIKNIIYVPIHYSGPTQSVSLGINVPC